MQTSAQRWSTLLILLFFSGVIFLFFHLYLRPAPSKNVAEISTEEPVLTQPTVGIINPTRGLEDAQVTVVLFGDFQCEACRDTAVSIDVVRREFPKEVRVVWKDFPNESLHEEATPSAISARCAGDQGAFWSYHDLLFSQMNLLNASTNTTLADALGLEPNAFARCLSTRSPLPRIQRDFEEGLELSITATPTLFINDERFVGAISSDELREAITRHLPL
ncbi:MAG: DSBA oxidoreductase [Candidatus Giovannonibacteria bacterium GW2011_GWA2_53_7]|uniref:DSBA oxidoreductase n=1 Tax=Candidatus Giovannonibacteria bacterium GW2011_GWA2_53_7 TaxID=1618650 RepID=A0A0G2AVD4_9BACT|nr:MAG: DSBA oxidoreductase [Candidatus Giovannonibacteria bacterium GW2011_GWA2_53_7]